MRLSLALLSEAAGACDLFAQDPETGEDLEAAAGVFPGEDSEDFAEVYDHHADAMQGRRGSYMATIRDQMGHLILRCKASAGDG